MHYAACGACAILFGLVSSLASATNVGPLDPSFGEAGMRNYGFLPVNGVAVDHAYAACPNADGTLVVLGGASGAQRVVTARLLPNGDYDTSFSSDGKETFNLGAYDAAFYPASCQSAGIVVARHTRDANGEEDLQIFRTNKSTGLLDTTFGSAGVVTLDLDMWNRGLGKEEIPLGVNTLPSGELAITGYATDSGGSLRAYVALLSASGSIEQVAFPAASWRYATSTVEAPDGRLWLFGEFAGKVARGVLNRQTLADEGVLGIATPPGTYVWAGAARAIDADTVALAVVQVPSGGSTDGNPVLAVFRATTVSLTPLPGAVLDAHAKLLSVQSLGSQGISLLPGRRVMYSATVQDRAGLHFAMAQVGRDAAGDRIETAFGNSGAQTASFRPDVAACAATLPWQSYARMTQWAGRPVFVASVDANCFGSNAGSDYLVGRLETNYLFADGFD